MIAQPAAAVSTIGAPRRVSIPKLALSSLQRGGSRPSSELQITAASELPEGLGPISGADGTPHADGCLAGCGTAEHCSVSGHCSRMGDPDAAAGDRVAAISWRISCVAGLIDKVQQCVHRQTLLADAFAQDSASRQLFHSCRTSLQGSADLAIPADDAAGARCPARWMASTTSAGLLAS